MTAIILVGGEGRRLRDVAPGVPKPLVKVAGHSGTFASGEKVIEVVAGRQLPVDLVAGGLAGQVRHSEWAMPAASTTCWIREINDEKVAIITLPGASAIIRSSDSPTTLSDGV